MKSHVDMSDYDVIEELGFTRKCSPAFPNGRYVVDTNSEVESGAKAESESERKTLLALLLNCPRKLNPEEIAYYVGYPLDKTRALINEINSKDDFLWRFDEMMHTFEEGEQGNALDQFCLEGIIRKRCNLVLRIHSRLKRLLKEEAQESELSAHSIGSGIDDDTYRREIQNLVPCFVDDTFADAYGLTAEEVQMLWDVDKVQTGDKDQAADQDGNVNNVQGKVQDASDPDRVEEVIQAVIKDFLEYSPDFWAEELESLRPCGKNKK